MMTFEHKIYGKNISGSVCVSMTIVIGSLKSPISSQSMNEYSFLHKCILDTTKCFWYDWLLIRIEFDDCVNSKRTSKTKCMTEKQHIQFLRRIIRLKMIIMSAFKHFDFDIASFWLDSNLLFITTIYRYHWTRFLSS